MSIQAPPYFYLPNTFLDDTMKFLPADEIKILLCFYRYMFSLRTGEVTPSTSFLHEKTGLSLYKTEESLSSLIDRGLVEEMYPDCYSLASRRT